MGLALLHLAVFGLCAVWAFRTAAGQNQCTGNEYDVYYTLASPDEILFSLESVGPITPQTPPSSLLKIVSVDPEDTHQSILGFGAALTGSSAYLIHNSPNQDEILESLFDPGTGMGINYLRLPMGGSDFQPEFPYTYDDMPAGETDYDLEHFSTEADLEFIVPVLLRALEINPEILIVAVPWSGPAWMKTSQDLYYGYLLDDENVYNTYADYFVRFLQDYQSYGVSISAISIQNEPEHESYTYPTMLLTAEQMTDFVKILGPKMATSGFGDVGIQVFDHNWDNTSYPIYIMDDEEAKQYVAGTALHCYLGNSGDAILVHNAHPDKDIYFTECSGGEWAPDWDHTLWWNSYYLFINQTRQYARTVLFWNIALDENYGPKWEQNAGCADCRGVITMDSTECTLETHSRNIEAYILERTKCTKETHSRNIEAYILEQFNKFVKRNAVRVGSTEQILDAEGNTQDVGDVSNVAFLNPDGQLVVQVVTGWEHNDPISLHVGGEYYTVDWSHIPGVGPEDHKQFITTLITFVQRCDE